MAGKLHKRDSSWYNTTCQWCGKPMHLKASHLALRKHGATCSRECERYYRREWFSGSGNHQYGLKGPLNDSYKNEELSAHNHNCIDKLVYVGGWYKRPNIKGRIEKHRYLVEKNHNLYPSEFFDFDDGWYYLKKGLVVHHKDGNHDNNDLNNLDVLTRGQHTRLHNKLRDRSRFRTRTTAVLQIKDGNVIAKYNSEKEAYIKTGARNIAGVLSGKIKTSGGFVWRRA